MRALARNRNDRYPTGQAMADDLEAVLHLTGFHARMLPDLLRESFGADVSKSQETLSSVSPELLAVAGGGFRGRRRGNRSRPAGVDVPAMEPEARGQPWSARRR